MMLLLLSIIFLCRMSRLRRISVRRKAVGGQNGSQLQSPLFFTRARVLDRMY